jgi:hypothetical protein
MVLFPFLVSWWYVSVFLRSSIIIAGSTDSKLLSSTGLCYLACFFHAVRFFPRLGIVNTHFRQSLSEPKCFCLDIAAVSSIEFWCLARALLYLKAEVLYGSCFCLSQQYCIYLVLYHFTISSYFVANIDPTACDMHFTIYCLILGLESYFTLPGFIPAMLSMNIPELLFVVAAWLPLLQNTE